MDVGRDVQGRFRPCNLGGPGNPFARKVAALHKALLDAVSEEDLSEMVEILKQQALEGDKGAIKLILRYCVGKPAAPQDPDRMDIDEWDRLQRMREGIRNTIPACLTCHKATTDWPCDVQDGPEAERVHFIHQQMMAEGRAVEPATMLGRWFRGEPQPGLPREEAPATEGKKQKERRELADGMRDERHSSPHAPLPNGGLNRDKEEGILGGWASAQGEGEPPRG